jgi:hydrogenase expression/formation protein HypD
MPVSAEIFRDPRYLSRLAGRLQHRESARPLVFMHVCGTHENAIARAGLRSLLPASLRVIAGPGCPVCVCPPEEIDLAARLALEAGVVVATFGDMLRVPGRISLAEARARGGDIRVVASAAAAVEIARAEPAHEVVLFAVGFETTACTTAAALLADPPQNFTVLSSHRWIPPALEALAAMEGLDLDGFLMPGHVLTVTGPEPFDRFARLVRRPCAVAGFEPVDILLGLGSLVEMADSGRDGLCNAYPRAVRPGGNARAVEAMTRAFSPVDARWRGLGTIPQSGMAVHPDLARHDARRRFPLAAENTPIPDDAPGCLCSRVMIGLAEPEVCSLFGTVCTPETPHGPCMVSAEGTCRSHHLYPTAESLKPAAESLKPAAEPPEGR